MEGGSYHLGAFWHNLTDTAITIVRAPGDTAAPQMRLRIWIRRYRVMLPIVARGYWAALKRLPKNLLKRVACA